ncbi:hypothetical protein PFLUV_G00167060 [Perca fluviatilis]|uniref:Uncharacterized protein n=1 Tax=Perca fluviatilis TaxID=8168 RepID=A0A6A5EDU7_PERFL|nr:hypothetical protein PFLUV_G00167060 [Perca fluviatilis]
MESEQLYHRGYCRNSYNSIASASSDEELLDGAGVIMDFHTTEDDNLLDGDATSPVALPLGPLLISIHTHQLLYMPSCRTLQTPAAQHPPSIIVLLLFCLKQPHKWL